jgi:hypothetical protein
LKSYQSFNLESSAYLSKNPKNPLIKKILIQTNNYTPKKTSIIMKKIKDVNKNIKDIFGNIREINKNIKEIFSIIIHFFSNGYI